MASRRDPPGPLQAVKKGAPCQSTNASLTRSVGENSHVKEGTQRHHSEAAMATWARVGRLLSSGASLAPGCAAQASKQSDALCSPSVSRPVVQQMRNMASGTRGFGCEQHCYSVAEMQAVGTWLKILSRSIPMAVEW